MKGDFMGYKTKEWRNSMRVRLDYNNMTDTFLGDKGFTAKKLSSYSSKATSAFRFVKENRGKDELFMGWTELPTVLHSNCTNLHSHQQNSKILFSLHPLQNLLLVFFFL